MAAATVPLKDRIQQQYSQLLDNFTNLLRSARLPDDAGDAGGRSQAQVRACFGFSWSLSSCAQAFVPSRCALTAHGQGVRPGPGGCGSCCCAAALAASGGCAAVSALVATSGLVTGSGSMLGPRRLLVPSLPSHVV